MFKYFIGYFLVNMFHLLQYINAVHHGYLHESIVKLLLFTFKVYITIYLLLLHYLDREAKSNKDYLYKDFVITKIMIKKYSFILLKFEKVQRKDFGIAMTKSSKLKTMYILDLFLKCWQELEMMILIFGFVWVEIFNLDSFKGIFNNQELGEEVSLLNLLKNNRLFFFVWKISQPWTNDINIYGG